MIIISDYSNIININIVLLVLYHYQSSSIIIRVVLYHYQSSTKATTYGNDDGNDVVDLIYQIQSAKNSII